VLLYWARVSPRDVSHAVVIVSHEGAPPPTPAPPVAPVPLSAPPPAVPLPPTTVGSMQAATSGNVAAERSSVCVQWGLFATMPASWPARGVRFEK
jgi:hypothetical protein